jgi:sarcosine oxidase, subunit gamma
MPELAPKPIAIGAAAWLRACPESARLSLRGNAAVRAAASRAFAVELPSAVNRAATQAQRAALCLGPDEHWLLAPAAELEAIREALSSALAALPHSLVDVSHRQAAFEVVGPHAEWLLNSGCPLDLALRSFPVGMCTRTVFFKAEVMLWRTAAESFRVEVWRSFAPYCLDMLREVAREIR